MYFKGHRKTGSSNDVANFARGWVYVMSNGAMPGLVKIGYSMRDPLIRAAELNHTGVPSPYTVECELLVSGPKMIEQMTHQLLRNSCEGKEWFRVSPVGAYCAILEVLRQNQNQLVFFTTPPASFQTDETSRSVESIKDFWDRHMPD